MTRNVLIAGLTLTVVLAAWTASGQDAAAGSTPTDKGLVAAWDFRNADPKVAKDLTGLGHDAKVVGKVTFVESPTGKAIVIDPKSYLRVKDHKDLQLPETLTVDVWFWVEAPSKNYQAVVIKDGPNYRIQVTPQMKAYFGLKGLTSAGKKTRLDVGAGKLTPQTWHRVTATWNKGVAEIYVDRKKTATIKRDVVPGVKGNLYMGRYGKLYTFSGRIDQVRIYNIVRPPQSGDEKPLEAKAAE